MMWAAGPNGWWRYTRTEAGRRALLFDRERRAPDRPSSTDESSFGWKGPPRGRARTIGTILFLGAIGVLLLVDAIWGI